MLCVGPCALPPSVLPCSSQVVAYRVVPSAVFVVKRTIWINAPESPTAVVFAPIKKRARRECSLAVLEVFKTYLKYSTAEGADQTFQMPKGRLIYSILTSSQTSSLYLTEPTTSLKYSCAPAICRPLNDQALIHMYVCILFVFDSPPTRCFRFGLPSDKVRTDSEVFETFMAVASAAIKTDTTCVGRKYTVRCVHQQHRPR